MNITKEQNEAVNNIVEVIAQKLGNEFREVDLIEAISTCARVAGSFLFRSFNFQIKDIETGSAILYEEANNKGPILITLHLLSIFKNQNSLLYIMKQ